MSTRFARTLAASLLLALLLVPASLAAQDEGISFPPGSGSWQGRVFFSGFYSIDTERSDGSFDVSVTDVIDDTHLSLVFTVGDDGQITGGDMAVDLVWFTESAGSMPATFESYTIMSAHFQEGTLSISGNAERFVASGTLSHTTDVNSARQGEIEEVSGTEDREVEWTFQVLSVNCAFAYGEILRSAGVSLMNNAWQPDSDRKHNELNVELVAWSTELPEEPEALQEVLYVEDRIRLSDYPEAEDLIDLANAWNDLSAQLAGLDQCQADQLGWTAVSERSWLTNVVRDALGKALDNADSYKAHELSWLWTVGLELQALDGTLISRFLDAFDQKLDQAIDLDDAESLVSIAAFAATYGYPDLYARAHEALESRSE